MYWAVFHLFPEGSEKIKVFGKYRKYNLSMHAPTVKLTATTVGPSFLTTLTTTPVPKEEEQRNIILNKMLKEVQAGTAANKNSSRATVLYVIEYTNEKGKKLARNFYSRFIY